MKLTIGILKSGVVAPPVAGITWNPLDKDPDIALSGGNLNAQRSVFSGSSYVSARGTGSHATLKYYFEATGGGAGQRAIGLANSLMPLSASVLGSTANSVGFWGHDGSLRIGGATVATAQTVGAGQVACVAIDFGGNLVWVKRAGNDWNGNPAANPATGVGGFAFAAAMPGAAFNACTINSVGLAWLLNNGQVAFVDAIPAGFVAWG